VGRKRKFSSLGLWMNGEHVGTWRVRSTGEHELSYASTWLESARRRPVSLSMPLRPVSQPYHGDRVRNFFDNLLPDNKTIRERLQARYHTPSINAFDLLTQVGRDCAGALQLLPEGETPGDTHRIEVSPLTDIEVEQRLREVPIAGRHQEADDFRISIAGAQEKHALLWHEGKWCAPIGATPSTHIFKLPLGLARNGIDLRTSVENEWLCTQLLKAYHVPVAECEIARFGTIQTLVVQRFDRRLAADRSWIVRLPQEDFAQVEGVSPETKYESDGGPGIRQILQRLLGSTNAQTDRLDFLRTQVLFWMLAAIDGHAKNFSVFIETEGRFRLAPRYDVMSAYPVIGASSGHLQQQKINMAMAFWRKNRHYRWAEIHRWHLEKTASDCGLASVVPSVIDDLVQATDGAIQRVCAALPPTFPTTVAEPIFSGLKGAAAQLANEKANITGNPVLEPRSTRKIGLVQSGKERD